MLRGLPHLAKYMPEARDARRLLQDQENEPDFDRISKAFPLPDTRAAMLGLALAAQNAGASIVAGHHGLQQLQGATGNNWVSKYTGAPWISPMVSKSQQRSFPSLFPLASALEAAKARAVMRANDCVSAAQDQQNMALLVELAARSQQQTRATPQSFAAAVESMWKPPSNFLG
jgi:hypothetical protein